MRSADVIVIGAGAMGSSAMYELARAGLRVLGFDRHGVANAMGSSHGGTRIMRLAYFQDPRYVALARAACDAWRALEDEAKRRLFVVTGSIDAGAPSSRVFDGAKRSCEENGLRHEILDAAEVHARWPGYRAPDSLVALFQPDGGFLYAERCIQTYVELATAMGARVVEERVTGWTRDGAGFTVTTERGAYRAARLVLTAGAWAPELVAAIRPRISVERQVVGWFEPLRPELFTPERFPVFNLQHGDAHVYGIPMAGGRGFKCGRNHHLHERVHPDDVRRTCDARDEAVVRAAVGPLFPDGMGRTLALETCLYANAPDERFLVDRVPDVEGACFAAGFSGHGFKFASVIGAMLCDMVTGARPRHDATMFSLSGGARSARSATTSP